MKQTSRIEGETIQSDQAYQPPELPASLLSGSDLSGVKLTDLAAKELAEQVRQGNQEAGNKLYDAYVETVYYFFHRRTKNTDEAQDLTSETFLRAFKGLLDSTWSGHPFPTWLFSIAKEVFFEWSKINSKQLNIDFAGSHMQKEEVKEEEILEEMLIRERRTIIWGAVDQLPEPFASLLKLRYRDGLSYAEIALRLGESTDTCKILHRQAMEKLREELQGTGVWNELKHDQTNA
jgi:RNA polymerase sigma-70 factor (ECF subfamily)